MSKRNYAFSIAPLVVACCGLFSFGEQPKDPYASRIAKASKQAELAVKRFRLAKGLKAELAAAEPLLANPVAFCVDDKGRFFVAETFRLHAGVTDNRSHNYWLKDDLAARTVGDRLAMYRKHLKKKFADYAKNQDRVRMLVDTNGDGKLDKATIYAGGFSRHEDGIGSGLIARNGKVWFTCIPDLWLLQDKNGDGRADLKKSLQTGYGVHVSFLGHDLHGLKFGPDGKLYFSVGDRGMHVTVTNGVLSMPDTGAILRCNRDGSELEIVASGFRNPQELAFDEFGNLFTGDNNADSGDKARWVYVVEGGDSGWRIGYQYLNAPPARLGPWNAEKLWHKRHVGQAAYILPPIDHITSGPSGLTYHPGVSLLPEKYRQHFFLCDFRGVPGNSGVWAFQNKPKGASFELVKRQQFIWNVLATDVDFAPDGGLYLTDWVDGWRMPMRGRIYKTFDPNRVRNAKVLEVRKILAEGMKQRSPNELVHLLEHEDMRIRQRAQFALAERSASAVLGRVVLSKKNVLPRLHGMWGLGQIGRNIKAADRVELAKIFLEPALADRDPEIRGQAAKVLGWWRHYQSMPKILPLLTDKSARVRFLATMSLGKLARRETVGPIFEMLQENNDQDVNLRHAGVMALTWIEERNALLEHAQDNSKAVRLAVLLAMRRLGMSEISGFLNDVDVNLVLEAARAINDVPIDAAMPRLAAISDRGKMPDALTYRALNAHFRLGKKENATALATYAARSNAPANMRLEALRHLGNWEKPSSLDRVIGLYRPLKPRPKQDAANALRSFLGGIFSGPNNVQREAARVAAKLGIKEVGPALFKIILNEKQSASARVESLRALDTLKDKQLTKGIEVALASASASLRSEGRRLLAKRDPQNALVQFENVLKQGEIIEQQGALGVLATLGLKKADGILQDWMDRLLAGNVRPELRLDLIEAASKRSNEQIKAKLALYQSRRSKKDDLAQFRETLYGGNIEMGRRLFFEKTEVSCVRCHKINGTGGDVGPDLSRIAKDKKRHYLLEALVAPSKQIAKGFDSVLVVLKDGKIKTGILKSESKKRMKLMTAEGTLFTVEKADIDERLRGKSAMPEDLVQKMSKREIRDLVEFLSSLN